VGLFNRKRDEEPATASGMKSFEDGKVPWASDRETIGQPVQGQTQGFDPSQLAGIQGIAGMLGGLQQVQQLQGGITIDLSQSQHSIDASNTELGEKMKEILRKYGIDPEKGATSAADPNQMMAMQQEMMQLIAEHQSGQSGS
jgi:hypothetical protein